MLQFKRNGYGLEAQRREYSSGAIGKLFAKMQESSPKLVDAGKPKRCALGAAMQKLVYICYGVYKKIFNVPMT